MGNAGLPGLLLKQTGARVCLMSRGAVMTSRGVVMTSRDVLVTARSKEVAYELLG